VIREFGELPPVQCLPFQINQLFFNLLVNACQAIESHGRIVIGTERAGDQVRIRITDNGVGIAAQDIGRIFEPFFTTRAVGKGRGLGLSVAYSIVKNHGGSIEVASEPGQGATFTVTLPIRRADAAHAGAAP